MTTEIWEYPSPFIIDVEVEEGDIDGLRHTNNGVYIGWCERAAWAHSDSLGLNVADYQRLDRAMALRHSCYDYLCASYLGEQLSVATWLLSSGKLKMERRFQIIRKSDQATLFCGQWQLVCIQLSSGKPTRLPPEFTQCYNPAVVMSKS